jgi:hypothetical protein
MRNCDNDDKARKKHMKFVDENEIAKRNTTSQTSKSSSGSTASSAAAAAAASPLPSIRHASVSSFHDNAHECGACAVIAAAAILSNNSARTGENHASSSMEEIESAGTLPRAIIPESLILTLRLSYHH